MVYIYRYPVLCCAIGEKSRETMICYACQQSVYLSNHNQIFSRKNKLKSVFPGFPHFLEPRLTG